MPGPNHLFAAIASPVLDDDGRPLRCHAHAVHSTAYGIRNRIAGLRARLERTLLWHVWERMLEIEFVDRSIALAGKAFVSFFPLVIVVAAFVPEGIRSSIISTFATRLGVQGEALEIVREAFASSDDIRRATGVLGLILTILFATSFTTALQRVYLRSWRRPRAAGVASYWRGATWLFVMLSSSAALGALRGALDGGLGLGVFIILGLCITTSLWWFTSWFLLLGQVRALASADGNNHGSGHGDVRHIGIGVDASGRFQQRSPVRLYRRRTIARHLVLRSSDLHPARSDGGTGYRRGQRDPRKTHPWRR